MRNLHLFLTGTTTASQKKVEILQIFCGLLRIYELYLYSQIFKRNISLNNSDSINLFTLSVDYIESSVVNPFGVPADVALHSSSPYHHRKGW